MSAPSVAAVRAEGVGKVYQTGRGYFPLLDWLLRGSRSRRRHSVVALEDVSFAVSAGEAVGIIGRNGAGKSTLLRVLGGIHRPSCGRVSVRGRTRTILDLHSLFVPQMTGRANIHFGMQLYGIPPARRGVLEEEVVAFAELGPAIDAPLRSYSSGMMLRLGFSLATVASPEVLLVDEVLMVGDELFQQKCYGKILELLGRGVTVLFATHDLYRAEKLCQRTLWIEQGRLVADGPTPAVIEGYQRALAEDPHVRLEDVAEEVRDWVYYQPGQSPFVVDSLRCVGGGERAEGFATGDPFAVEFEVETNRPIEGLRIFFFLHQPNGTLISQDVFDHQGPAAGGAGRRRVRFEVPSLPLGPGRYYVSVALGEGDSVSPYYDFERQRTSFVVQNADKDVRFRRGIVRLAGRWEVER